MATFEPIGFVRSPYTATTEVPKGLGARHDVEGALEILSELEAGLTDIEGFSHLFVLWVFDRARGRGICSPPRRVTIASTACSLPARHSVRIQSA